MNKKGAIYSVVIAAAAVVAIGAVFTMNASPYVNVAQAKISRDDALHVAGSIEKNSIVTDIGRNQIRFTLKDDTGALPVVYTGSPVSNLGDSTKVVAIGGMENGQFVSSQLLVKCPSKYEAQQAPK